MVSREYGDLAGAGGVKDVVLQLAETLAARPETRVSVILPAYGFMDTVAAGFEELADPADPTVQLTFDVEMNYQDDERAETCSFLTATLGGVQIYLVQADRFTDKQSVYTYTDADAGLD
jgi:starch synthase